MDDHTSLSCTSDDWQDRRVGYPAVHHPYFVVPEDLEGDGRPDLVVVNRDSNSAKGLSNNGDGIFAIKMDPQRAIAPDRVRPQT
ncbi:uncharacterized protein SOCE26_083060 [Sorangium cellulosum]|uniref:Uncharacterized protein n=1 Tax=Sorangium cellulosum TaxID=56 RepID=A0A2L0F5J3_SORCE|nr:hypothetical protein [Sorangium cellulosum]AUX46797.1 uncharacterized protein SOCE26_083060 [Sorangium cellulosum]